jgi:hypothetical protein
MEQTDQPLNVGSMEGLGAGAETRIQFEFGHFNPRRAMRGAEAASLTVIDPDDPDGPCMLWMSKADVGRNMMAFGRDPALVQAWDAYEAYERARRRTFDMSGSRRLSARWKGYGACESTCVTCHDALACGPLRHGAARSDR